MKAKITNTQENTEYCPIDLPQKHQTICKIGHNKTNSITRHE